MDANANESLTSLQKAYADVILNTLKESASRVLVSERKALRYQYELKATKEQSLQMLLRLKRLSDSKASEAEVTIWNQQRKIKELETQLQEAEDRERKAEMGSVNQKNNVEELQLQLNEAEDIVKDLREEFRQLEAELRSLKKRKLQQQGECDNYVQDTSNVNVICDSQSAIQFNLPPLTEIDAQAVETSDSDNGEVVIHEPAATLKQVTSSPSDVDPKTKPVEAVGIDNRIIKYTFQRKRKKEMQIDPVEMKKCSKITESSSDSTCLEEVALQLIALSELGRNGKGK